MTYPLRPFLGEVSIEEPPLWLRSTVFDGLGLGVAAPGAPPAAPIDPRALLLRIVIIAAATVVLLRLLHKK